MKRPAKKKRVNRKGITRAVLLRPEQDAALNRLIEETGFNRNSLVRLIAITMTPDELRALEARPGALER